MQTNNPVNSREQMLKLWDLLISVNLLYLINFHSVTMVLNSSNYLNSLAKQSNTTVKNNMINFNMRVMKAGN